MTPANVFICHAHEDKSRGLDLYQALKQAGELPWIDSVDIAPGELWQVAIQRAIKAADVVVILLSNVSVVKRGYLQREINDALELWKEKLEDDIFLIPVRLDECQPPAILSRFQWVDLWTSNGLTRLLGSIRTAHNRKLEESAGPATAGTIIQTIELSERSHEPPRFNASASFPRYVGPGDASAFERANAIIAGGASETFEGFVTGERRRRPDQELDDRKLGESILLVTCTTTLRTPNLLSARLEIFWYGAGGAHGNRAFQHFNFQMQPFRCLGLMDVFEAGSEWERVIREMAIDNLLAQASDEGWKVDDYWLELIGNTLKEIERTGFNMTTESLVLQWPDYATGPYAWGARQVMISFEAIQPLLQRAFHRTLG